jgi:hypothetical protein
MSVDRDRTEEYNRTKRQDVASDEARGQSLMLLPKSALKR